MTIKQYKQYILYVGCPLVLILFIVFLQTLPPSTPSPKNYRGAAYDLWEIAHKHPVEGRKIWDIYKIIRMDNFVSKEEFDMFYKEILISYPHIKKYGLYID